MLNSNFKFTNLDPGNFLSSSPTTSTNNNNNTHNNASPVEKSNARIDNNSNKQFHGVKKNLEKYFGSNAFNIVGPSHRCSPIQSAPSNSLNYPCCSTTMPVAPARASSEDVCTLFTNSCQISSGTRRQLPPIGVFWDIGKIYQK